MYNIRKMMLSLKIGAIVLIAMYSFLVLAVQPSLAQKFWSPREIVLDTYTRPIPFRCGNEICLAYELHITNMDRYPLALQCVEVFTNGFNTPFETYSGELLEKSLSRIRVPEEIKDNNIVNAGQRAILHILLGYDDRAKLPGVVSHRVVYSYLRDDESKIGVLTQGGVLNVASDKEALIISGPLGEGIWMAGRGVEDGCSGHRRGAIRPQNGIPYQKARYAFDFIRFSEDGETCLGNRLENASWLTYGSEVLAVADAQVAAIQDGVPDSPPLDPTRLNKLTGKTLGGNYIVLDLGKNLYAFYGHLKPGSLLVDERETVKKGQVIGLIGNSGNSDIPHLHFQINRGIHISGEAVPYVFEEYEYLGESGAAGPYASMIAETIAGRASKKEQTKARSSGLVSPVISIADTIRAQIFQDLKRNGTLAPNSKGEVRTLEMPRSGSMIRFHRD